MMREGFYRSGGRLLGFVLFSVLCWAGSGAANDKRLSVVNCDIQSGACSLPLGGGTVTLEILPRPVRAMSDLTFRVTMEGGTVTGSPTIDLNMLVMDMGPNRVLLKPDGKGGYEGRGVIVRCRSGIRTWAAKVTLPGVGGVDFFFDVFY